MRVKDMPVHTRPREKLLEKGSGALTDAELIAIVLRTGYEGKSALDVAKRILSTYPLKKLVMLDASDLANIKGLGISRAAAIKAVHELSIRCSDDGGVVAIKSPADIAAAANGIRLLKKEHLMGIYLDARNHLMHQEILSIGTVTEGIVHPREVFSPALEHRAVSVVVAHNHPSGDPSPSVEDIAVTKRLQEAGKLLDISLYDHVIVAKRGYISLREKGYFA